MNIRYDKNVDIFSFGILCFTIITGKMPFNGETDSELAKYVINNILSFKLKYKTLFIDVLLNVSLTTKIVKKLIRSIKIFYLVLL